MKNRELVSKGIVDLVNRISDDITFTFSPRFVEVAENKKEQTNPYAGIEDYEKTEVIVEACSMILAQIAAMSIVSARQSNPELSEQDAVSAVTRRIRVHVDEYMKAILAEQEASNENKG